MHQYIHEEIHVHMYMYARIYAYRGPPREAAPEGGVRTNVWACVRACLCGREYVCGRARARGVGGWGGREIECERI
jgi:hypothetical protein